MRCKGRAQIPDSGQIGPVSGSGIGDFIELLKPRVMSLVVFTALTGMVAAPGAIHPVLGIIALLAIAIGAGAAGALNMWYDADIDARMARTAARPIPRGRLTADEALSFGSVLSVFSILTLGVLINWTAGILLAITIGFYLFIYTMWLKRLTPQNIVIGGAAGSFPPMIGWAAVTGSVSIESVLMFLIIFVWTPPHFWALALYRCRDYERVGVPMLPVVAGPAETRRQIWLYSLVLVPLAMLPVGHRACRHRLCGELRLCSAPSSFTSPGVCARSPRAARRTPPPSSCSPSRSFICSSVCGHPRRACRDAVDGVRNERWRWS